MTMRFPSPKLMALVGVLVALIAVPAVAWALTSPRTTVDTPAEGAEVSGEVLVSGEARHRVGVAGIRLVIRNLESGEYWSGSSWQSGFVRFDVPVENPGAMNTRWSYSVPASALEPGQYGPGPLPSAWKVTVTGSGETGTSSNTSVARLAPKS